MHKEAKIQLAYKRKNQNTNKKKKKQKIKLRVNRKQNHKIQSAIGNKSKPICKSGLRATGEHFERGHKNCNLKINYTRLGSNVETETEMRPWHGALIPRTHLTTF